MITTQIDKITPIWRDAAGWEVQVNYRLCIDGKPNPDTWEKIMRVCPTAWKLGPGVVRQVVERKLQ